MAIIKRNRLHNGTQVIHRFNNNYGASVVCHKFSYGGGDGLFELAVIKFKGNDWTINYATPITSDVLGYLTQEDVNDLLARIEKLKG